MPTPEEPKFFVRLTTTTWADKRGVYQKRCIRYLRRRSSGTSGTSVIEYDAEECADVVFKQLGDLRKHADGIYEVVARVTYDFDRVYIDDYEYHLERCDEQV